LLVGRVGVPLRAMSDFGKKRRLYCKEIRRRLFHRCTMGSNWSAENIFSWRSQLERVKRWSHRLHEVGDADSFQERLDCFLAFFVNCYALRDWFINSNSISQTEMDDLVQSNEAMRLCRDICNRSKHLKLDRPASTEASFSIGREYSPSGDRFFITYLGSTCDLFWVAMSCVKFWDDFLTTYKPPEPTDPFTSTATR